MRQVNIHEAKTQLSKLIAAGEEVIIFRYGKAVARLTPYDRRLPGGFPVLLVGNLRFHRNFLSLCPPNC